jgi:hypothetical protein
MTTPTPRSALLTACILAVATAGFVFNARQPPKALPKTASPRVFSAERAWRHVEALAAKPHPLGSPAHDAARDYVIHELTALGLVPDVQVATGTRWGTAARVQNVIARVPGTEGKGPAVLLMAHYDGVPSGPAASDDGAGVAAVLEVLRAMRTLPRIRNDVIVLITDGEEMGLLGADAFVSQHPWAREVGVILNVEARGTNGRSMMFETGRRNLDVVRVLRQVPDVSASSLMVTIYRNLPNDTDLSVFAPLGLPALNFAFIGGVARYHTPADDPKHLDPRSLQHHGQQLLALAEAFGREPLPRPKTGDAVFFDLPLVGVVFYPEVLALPLAILVALAAVGGGVFAARGEPRRFRAALFGIIGACGSMIAGAFVVGWLATGIARLHEAQQWDGVPGFAGVYATALALAAITVSATLWSVVRRGAGVHGAWTGALFVWALFAIASAAKLPGVSFLLAWPLAGAAVLAWSRAFEGRVSEVNGWAGTVLALAVLVPITAMVGGYALPLEVMGGQAAAVLVAMTSWLLAPQLETLLTERRWRGVGLLGASALGVAAYGMATVRRSEALPTPVTVNYAMMADSGEAWLASSAGAAPAGSWGAQLMGADARAMIDTVARAGAPTLGILTYTQSWRGLVRAMPRLPLVGATVDSLQQSTDGAVQRLSFRVRAPDDVAAIAVRLPGATVRQARVEGRVVALRSGARPDFVFSYFAPSPTGVTFELEVAGVAPLALDVVALRYGVPLEALALPARPAHVVPAHRGDMTMVVRRIALAKP